MCSEEVLKCFVMFVFMQEKIIDPFVIYEGSTNYSSLRKVVFEARYGRQVEKLVEAVKVI